MGYSYTITSFIVIVSWIGFWLPVSAMPARVTLGITTLLTLLTTGNFVRSSLPPISYVTAIDVWVGFCTVFVLLALLLLPISLYFTNKKETPKINSVLVSLDKRRKVHPSSYGKSESVGPRPLLIYLQFLTGTDYRYGTELDTNIDDGMEQSLPSSATSSRHSSRPGTPMESTCKRRHDLNHTAKVYSDGVTTTKRTIEGYRRNGHEDDNPLIIDQLQLAAYEEYVQRAINSNCVIFGDFNVTHNYWNCSNNSPRGVHLKNFIDNTELQIAFPHSPTRYGYNSSNTLDFALINNFDFPFTIESIPELSSDHNPVMPNFSLTLPIHKANPRAFSTCWSAFKKNITKSLHLPNYKNITNPLSLEHKISMFTDKQR
ncbi:neur_chan_memb domain-containing protein [Trichonephila clavipes]|nr:neur_chan_memb domain-containing protein [Trichonephila clavipes]